MPRVVWALVVARAINKLGAFSLPFLTVLISGDFGASMTTAGLLSAAFGLATIPSRLAGGRLAGILGRRRTIVLGLTGCAVAQLAIAAADSLLQVAVFAVVLGLAFELYEPPSQGLIADAVGPADRVRAFSLLNAALAVAGTGAGLIAAAVGRWDLRWLFVVDAVTCLACALALRLVLPADRPRRQAEDRAAGGVPVHPWRDRALWAMFGCGTVFALLAMQVVMGLPLTLGLRGLEPADAGLLFTASAVIVVTAQPALRLRRIAALSDPAALALGYVLMTLGLAGYALASSLSGFLVGTGLWSLGEVFVLGPVFGVVAALAPPGGSDRYLASYGISWGIATTAAPITATQLLDRFGATTLWTATAVLALALAAAQPLLVAPLTARTRPPSPTGPGAPRLKEARAAD
ncbi:MFS transporter [Streptomyces sp. NPDC048659]|uniref:MFS transporter n=1 Tax=Streptomyces sp. NPDC048659 TaxID=3155489 RepID=UPI0034268E66